MLITMPWLRMLSLASNLKGTGFDSRPFQVIFVVVKVTGNVFI